MKTFLIALGLGASLFAVAAPASAKHDDRHQQNQRFDRQDNGNHNGWNRAGGNRWHGNYQRHRYVYYRHGHRYYGWR